MKFHNFDTIGYWVHRVMGNLKLRFEETVQDIGLTAPESMLLFVIDRHGPGSLMELSKIIGHAHPSVLRHVDALEEKGFVERIPHSEDRRIKTVQLTEKGNILLPKIREAHKKITGLAEGSLSPDQVKQLIEMLKKINQNIEGDGTLNECNCHHN